MILQKPIKPPKLAALSFPPLLLGDDLPSVSLEDKSPQQRTSTSLLPPLHPRNLPLADTPPSLVLAGPSTHVLTVALSLLL